MQGGPGSEERIRQLGQIESKRAGVTCSGSYERVEDRMRDPRSRKMSLLVLVVGARSRLVCESGLVMNLYGQNKDS